MTLSTVERAKSPLVQDGKSHPGRRMTEREFVEWVDEKTWAEWVDGEVIVMPPVSIANDRLEGWLRTILMLVAEQGDVGTVTGPEFTVRFGRQRRRRVPDLSFVARAREAILQQNHIEGAPDLIIELVSPESVVRDWREKYLDYERAGVREYWVIDPANRRMEVYRLARNGKYQLVEEVEGKIGSEVLRGFYLRPKWVLGSRPPSLVSVLRELGIHV